MYKYSVSILGTGFIGLCSAACFADKNIKVLASTHNEKKANMINDGKAPFYEADLQEMMDDIKANKPELLQCLLDPVKAVLETDISMITQGTPMREDKSINLGYIESTAREIGKALKQKESYHLVVVRSTVVPGTTRNLVGKLITEVSGKIPGRDFGLCMQPEFLAEGSSVSDTLHPDRIIIGAFDERSGDLLQEFYEYFYGDHLQNCPILRMNLESAELVKYGNNCLLSTKISYSNEFANFAQLVPNVDIIQVMKGVGLDYRINSRFLQAGVGFGGSCFHKDVNAIKAWSKSKGYTSRLLEAVLGINDDQAIKIVDIAEELAGKLAGKRVTLLGLSFKPGTDDMREAPSIRVVNELIKRGITNIIGYDPKAKETAKIEFGDRIEYADTIEEALKDSECAILITEWNEFKTLKPEDFMKNMKEPNVIDGRRLFDYEEFDNAMPFRAIGRINLD
ncbi:MAG TPA: UDP-glucose/GDP-mannose dehydrogenase family protein [Candidatus Nanopelagicaceae bacterium]|nr:UDP-glucose/GDP-mannose dehydrogenase family protein [Candidatus Nanopelagicaceae bacterium]